jgi:hypothetical protein
MSEKIVVPNTYITSPHITPVVPTSIPAFPPGLSLRKESISVTTVTAVPAHTAATTSTVVGRQGLVIQKLNGSTSSKPTTVLLSADHSDMSSDAASDAPSPPVRALPPPTASGLKKIQLRTNQDLGKRAYFCLDSFQGCRSLL